MNGCIDPKEALLDLLTESQKQIMGGKKFLTNEEYNRNLGKFNSLAGKYYAVEKKLVKSDLL